LGGFDRGFPHAIYRGVLPRRTPDLPIQIVMQAMRGHAHAGIADLNAFGTQASGLLAEMTAAFGKRDAPVGTHDAVPRQFHIVRGLAQGAAGKSRAPGQPRARGDLAVTGNVTARNRGNRGVDAKVFLFHGVGLGIPDSETA